MLKEYTRPLRTPIHADENILSILQHRVQRAADQPLIEYKTAQGQWGAFYSTGIPMTSCVQWRRV